MDMQETPPASDPTAGLNDQQKKVYETMKRLNAVGPDRGKTADDIMKAGKFSKGQMLAWIQDMEKKGVVKRLARDKAAWYYLTR